MLTVDHELLTLLVAIITTLIGKWIWDRFVSKSSRVTKEVCELNIAGITRSIMTLECKINAQLIGDAKIFDTRVIEIIREVRQERSTREEKERDTVARIHSLEEAEQFRKGAEAEALKPKFPIRGMST